MGIKYSKKNKKLVDFGRTLFRKYPFLRPGLAFGKNAFFSKPTFSGWGMRTKNEVPWVDEDNGNVFRKAADDIKKQFQFNIKSMSINSKNVDSLKWRHWIVSYAVRHAIEFTTCDDYNFVECGVAQGMSAFFALREISSHTKTSLQYSMHLYDSWSGMKKESLLESEQYNINRYDDLDLDLTKKNLIEFKDHVIYHPGHIPTSFNNPPKPPKLILYLHIDLNSASVTLSTIEFFYSSLTSGGVILFDDYGSMTYTDTKKLVDKYFHDKSGILLKLPTGQAIFFKR